MVSTFILEHGVVGGGFLEAVIVDFLGSLPRGGNVVSQLLLAVKLNGFKSFSLSSSVLSVVLLGFIDLVDLVDLFLSDVDGLGGGNSSFLSNFGPSGAVQTVSSKAP